MVRLQERHHPLRWVVSDSRGAEGVPHLWMRTQLLRRAPVKKVTAEERAERVRRAALAAKIAAVLEPKNTLHILMCGGMLTRREKKS